MRFLFNLCLALSARPVSPLAPTAPSGSRAMMLADAWLFSLGLVCAGYLLYRFVSRTRQHSADGVPLLKIGPKPWGVIELIQVTAGLMALFILSNAFCRLVAVLTHRTTTQLAWLVLVTELVLRVAVLAALVYVSRRRKLDLSSTFGLRALPPLDAVGWAIVFGLACLSPVQLLGAEIDRLCRFFHFHPSEQPITELFATVDSHLVLALLVVFAVVVAPVFEEVFFRGFMYPALKQRLGAGGALGLVSALFALSHVHLPSFPPLFVLAVGLALAYEWTGSLLVPIGMHALFNGIMVVKLLFERIQP